MENVLYEPKITKLKTTLGIIRLIKNFPLYFAEYFGIINQKYLQYTLNNNIRITVRSKTHDSGIIAGVMIHNEYTPKGFEIATGDIVVDVGAHIGVFSIFASTKKGAGKVYAIEPAPDNYALLEQNITNNNIKNIYPFNLAISAKNGKQDFFLYDDTVGHSLYVRKGMKSNKISVKTSSFENFMKQNKIKHIDFLKIDCEGAEYPLLFNLPKTILEKIKKLSIEYHYVDNENNIFVLKEFLQKRGFEFTTLFYTPTSGILYAKQKETIF